MGSASLRIVRSTIVILAVWYYLFFPLLPGPLNTLLLPLGSSTSSPTSTDYQRIIIYIFCEQSFLFLCHRWTPGKLMFMSIYATVVNSYLLWSGDASAGTDTSSAAQWNVLIDVVRVMGILFMARDISRPSVAGSSSGSQASSSSSSSSSVSNSHSFLRLSFSQTLPWKSCTVWTLLFGTSVLCNVFAPSDPGSQVLLSRLSYDQFQTVWIVFFARIVLAMPWRSIVLGITTKGEVRIMVFNLREKRICGVEGCGFGWEEGLNDFDVQTEGSHESEILEEGKEKIVVVEGKGERKRVENKHKKPFKFSCNLNLLLSALGSLAVLVRLGLGWGWAFARSIDGYFS